MLRPLRLLTVSAVLFAAACGDKDDDLVSNLVANGVQLTTAEDTPISGNIAVSGQLGRLRTTVTSGPSHGSFALSVTGFTYTPEANYSGEDSVTVAIADDDKTASATVSITITPVNDPPSITITRLTVAEDTSLLINAATLGVTDIDSAGPFTVTVRSTGAYTVNGNEVTPLRDFNGDLSVNVTLSDGESSAEAVVVVTVTPVNDAPIVVVPAPQSAPNGAPFAVGGVSVSDVDVGGSPMAIVLSANAGALLSLTTLTDLTFTSGDGTSDTTMSFSGTTSAVNAALATLTVASPTPNVTITVTITANDQGATGVGGPLDDTDALAIGFGSADLPPFNTTPSSLSTNEDVALVINGVSVADADADADDTVTMVLTVTHGTLSLNGTTGLTGVSGLATPSVSFTGTFANVNAAMNGMTYTPASNYAGADTLTVNADSAGLTDTDVVTITVNAVNDAPSVTGPTTAIDVAAAGVVTFAGANLVSVSDVDAADAPVKVTVTTLEGTLSATGATVDDSTPGTLIFTGTLAAVNADLATAQWDAGAVTGSGKSVTFVADDQGATGAGGNKTATLVVTINVGGTVGAQDDAYKAQGNTRRIIAAPGVLANDSGAGRAVVSTAPMTSPFGGTLTIAANGGFVYDPPRGKGGREQDGGIDDTFTYEMTAGGSNATATVTINVRRVIWYVDSGTTSATVDQDGTFIKPYATLGQAVDSAVGPPGSHFGTWIYVYNRGDAYTADVTLPDGTTLIGSGRDFDLQDADEGDTLPPTTLPALGAPAIIPANATAIRLQEQSRITGFNFVPGATTTGPAIAGLAENSGSVDHVTISGFATAIALTDTSPFFFTVDNVDITNASNTAIRLETGTPSGLIITSTDFTNVERAIAVNGTAGPNDNGSLNVTIAGCGFSNIGLSAVTIAGVAGGDAQADTSVRVSASTLTNTVADGPAMTPVAVSLVGGTAQAQLADLRITRYNEGVRVIADSASVNLSIDNVDFLTPTEEIAYRVVATNGGNLNVTASRNDAAQTDTTGFYVENACLNMTASAISTTNVAVHGLSLNGAIVLDGFTTGGNVNAYFAAGTTPRFVGSVGGGATPTGGTCAPAPEF